MERMIRSDILRTTPTYPKTLQACHERIRLLEEDKRELLELLVDAKSELARTISYRLTRQVEKKETGLPKELETSLEEVFNRLDTSGCSEDLHYLCDEDIGVQFDIKYAKGKVLMGELSQDFSK